MTASAGTMMYSSAVFISLELAIETAVRFGIRRSKAIDAIPRIEKNWIYVIIT